MSLDSMVRVHNRNKYEYRELFRGKEIIIPANSFIRMDYEEANRFLGMMPSFKRLKDGNQDPTSYKWLEIDKDDKKRVELVMRNEVDEKSKRIFVCHACGKEFSDKKTLMKHVKSDHMDQLEEKSREEMEKGGDDGD